MTLPVSSYEELLVQVRELTHETIQLQRQLSSDLFDDLRSPDVNHNFSSAMNDAQEKFIPDNATRQLDLSRRYVNEQQDHNCQRYRTSFYKNFDTDGIRTADFTRRLLAFRSQTRHAFAPEEEFVNEEPKRPTEVRGATASSGCRVGAEGRGRRAVVAGDEWRPPRYGSILSSPSDVVDELDTSRSPSGSGQPMEPSRGPRSPVDGDEAGTERSDEWTSVRCSLMPRCKEDATEPEAKEEDEQRTVGTPSPEFFLRRSRQYDESSDEDNRPNLSSQNHKQSGSYRGSWPVKKSMWANEHSDHYQEPAPPTISNADLSSVMSFSSHSGSGQGCAVETRGDRRLGAKMDVVYNLLGMLSSSEGREDMSATLLQMSNYVDSCVVMRQSGCLPLLVQLIHAPGQNPETRERASRALHNVVYSKSDERAGRREARVLRFLEQLRDYCQALRISLETGQVPDDVERHPSSTIAALMKLSFDEAHRHAMCQLGGLHAVAELIEMDHLAHGSECDDQNCITLRRYAGMALTNLTFGDGNNKALLCSFREFMKALVSQLRSPSDDLRQVTASVLRNLSWRADSNSKQTLREVGAVTGLMKAAMEGRKESALKSILSALWNLSAHCSQNKVDICAVEGALAFLVDMLSYKAPSKTLAIVENAGGILRNVSSYIAVRDDYRKIVRERGCLQVLLQQLRSPSLTVVSNACGALWNLSARCPHDQRLLWDLGAVPMLRSLVHSKHKMISMGSSAALKNLLSARPSGSNLVHLDSTARGLGLPTLPSLAARRQRALEQEIDQNLSETCDNIEPSLSPTNKDEKFAFKDHSFLGANTRVLRSYQLPCPGTSNGKFGVTRSESRESMRSVTSTHSDTMFERVNRNANAMSTTDLQLKQQSASLHSAVGFDSTTLNIGHAKGNSSERKYVAKYKNAIPERLKPNDEIGELRCTNSTISWTSALDQEATCSQIMNSSVEDNLSPLNRSSSSKEQAGSRSSISEDEIEIVACSRMQRERSKNGVILEYDKDSFTMSDGSDYNGSFNDKPVVILRDPLSTIKNAMLPSSSGSQGLFANYAETDLDQPTDYSLRYAEKVTEEDEKEDSAYFASEEHEDTMKTYCTEGTPHDNSLNTSRAASTSDLQDENRVRNSSKKLLDQNKLHYFESNEKSNGLAVDSDDNLARNSPSVRTTPTHVVSSDSQYNEDYESADFTESDTELHGEYKCQNDIHGTQFDYVPKSEDKYNSTVVDTETPIDQASDEDDEGLLAACINIGMQHNRHRHSYIAGNTFEALPKPESNLARYQTSTALDQVESNVCNVAAASELSTSENQLNNDTKGVNPADKRYSLNIQIESNMHDKYNTYVIRKSPREKTNATTENLDLKDVENKNHSGNTLEESTNEAGSTNDSTPVDPVLEAVQNASCEKSIKPVEEEIYRRQRDPDAMIASLDRLTVTLVQQTEAMRERESNNAMKQSTLSDTWNEDSHNDVSFPSISISAPIVASFRSDDQDEELTILSSIIKPEETSMTDSRIIQEEANRLAEAVKGGVFRHTDFETTSMTSVDLDAINPPSAMGSLISLTASYVGSTDVTDNVYINRDRSNSASLPPQSKNQTVIENRLARKKSLPLGMVAKRALGQTSNHTGSLENLLNECTMSHLESVKPPSMMDELFDNGDMENSMLSVASITSEIADSKDQESQSLTTSDQMFDLVKPLANVLSITCMRYAESMQMSTNNSLSECLENINPPSLFNEVSDMDDTTLEAVTDTFCSDTLCPDMELNTEEVSYSFMANTIDEVENDTDEAVTPISTEYCVSSSAESTPKKKILRNHLTPKQKRNLAKERYKTYTIAAEMVKLEEERKKQEIPNTAAEKISQGKYSPFSKLTPKQRRQEDRARFQTQVLANPFPDLGSETRNNNESSTVSAASEKPHQTTPVRSAIPMLTKIPFCKTRKKKSVNSEEKGRYRTHVLDSPEDLRDTTSEEQVSSSGTEPTQIRNILEQNATIVLNNLNDTNTTACNSEELLLDCETLSLVSNDAESEQSMRMRFMNGVSRKLLVSRSDDADNTYTIVSNRELKSELTYPEPLRNETETARSESPENDSEDESNSDGQIQETKRPRIIKPGMVNRDGSTESNVTDKSDESPKAIRGRRKALYSNPITRKPTPQSSPLKQANTFTGIPMGRSNTSPIVRATRATTLRQNTNAQQSANRELAKSNSSPRMNQPDDVEIRAKSTTAAKRVSVPQKGSSLTWTKSQKRHSTPATYGTSYPSNNNQPVKPLERQGTFTKDEPEVENAPTVLSSPLKTRIAKPIKSIPAKVNSVVSKSKISVRTYQSKPKVNSNEKIQTSRIAPQKRIPTAKNSADKMSNNNTVADSSKSPKRILGPRSNSNTSIVSNSSTTGVNRKLTKEATSKIASLWKKVEESKSKQKFEKPDSRQWITAAQKSDETEPTDEPAYRLFRSSTFEGVSQTESQSSLPKFKRPLIPSVQSKGVKYRNSCDLSGMNVNEAPCKISVKPSESQVAKNTEEKFNSGTLVLRRRQNADVDAEVDTDADSEANNVKRLSRLGSFIRVDPNDPENIAQAQTSRAPASAIVPPFNYNPRQEPHSKVKSNDSDTKSDTADYDIVTGSTRITTV